MTKSENSALEALYISLKDLGIPVNKIRWDDTLEDLISSTNDDLNFIHLQIELEAWMGEKMNPAFFYEKFLRMKLDNAVKWLAERERKGDIVNYLDPPSGP